MAHGGGLRAVQNGGGGLTGGVKAGHTIGATYESVAEAVERVDYMHDLHVTLLRLLGLDDSRLTYFHHGHSSN